MMHVYVCMYVSRFFPRNVEVNMPGRWLLRPILVYSDSKTTFARLIRQNN